MDFKTKQISVTFVTLDGADYRANEVYTVLEELEMTDMIDTIVVYDSKLRDYLESKDVLHTNSRGGSWQGNGLKKFADEYFKAYVDFTESDRS